MIIESLQVEKYCAESNNFTLKINFKGILSIKQLTKIKEVEKSIELSSKCVLVRDTKLDTIIHFYREKSYCLVTNAGTINQGILSLENILGRIEDE